MIAFSYVRKDSGNVDLIMTWRNVTEFPSNCPVDTNVIQIVKLDNYNYDMENYEAIDLTNNTAKKKLIITSDKSRTLVGGTVNIHIKYPDNTINETVHTFINDVPAQDVLIVNGEANISYSPNILGFNRIGVKSTSHFGYNTISIEVL
jgi:hypothetical protein